MNLLVMSGWLLDILTDLLPNETIINDKIHNV